MSGTEVMPLNGPSPELERLSRATMAPSRAVGFARPLEGTVSR
jgi:hypothetical protein